MQSGVDLDLQKFISQVDSFTEGPGISGGILMDWRD